MKSKWMLMICCLLLTGWACSSKSGKTNGTTGSDNAATVDSTTTKVTQVVKSTEAPPTVDAVKEDANAPINIPATNGVMTKKLNEQYGTYDKLKRITDTERKEMGIDGVKVKLFDKALNMSKYPNTALSKGKEIYKGAKGKIATFLIIQEDPGVFEFLVSYNTAGAVIDCIQIGQRMAYSDDNMYGNITGNQVKCIYSWTDEGESGSGSGTNIYKISDDLHFAPVKK